MPHMNSNRALFLVVWTIAATFLVLFASGWMMSAWDVFHPSAYKSLFDFIAWWSWLLLPYPLVLFLPRRAMFATLIAWAGLATIAIISVGLTVMR